MKFLSFQFWIFICLGMVVYYALPKKCQWIVLLVLSSIFYLCCGGVRMLPFISCTIIASWGGALGVERVRAHYQVLIKAEEDREKKKQIKASAKSKQKMILAAVFAVVIGMLVFLKYSGFIFGIDTSNFIVPLGISYYTLQCIGYFLNVYWSETAAEKNIFKVALFTMFFPQIIQGPIAKWEQLSGQFYKEHLFELERVEKAVILIGWGYVKKTTIADTVAAAVNDVFSNCINYGFKEIALALVLYSAQLYADFSGGIDIVMGVAEIFDIQLTDNFRRPFFSESLSEFWRRWHISLGVWMKEFIYYPLAASKWMTKSVTSLKKKFNSEIAKAFALLVGNVVVFLIVGIWHGADWHFVVWGLYNGIIISVADICRPSFLKVEDKLHISQDSRLLKVFRIIRTFIVINISWIFDRNNSMSEAGVMIRQLFAPSAGIALQHISWVFYVSLLILIVVSVYQEMTGKSVRDTIMSMKLPFRWAILLVFFLYAATFAGVDTGEAGFMYAVF